MDIKEYPAFGPLAREHKPLFDRVFKENPPQISEFTFTNLFAWRDVYALSLCRFEGFYIFRSDSLQRTRFFPPIGTGAVKKAFEKILRDSKGSCIRVPEAQALACQAVHLRRRDPGCAVTAHVAKAKIVGQDDDEVRPAGAGIDSGGKLDCQCANGQRRHAGLQEHASMSHGYPLLREGERPREP